MSFVLSNGYRVSKDVDPLVLVRSLQEVLRADFNTLLVRALGQLVYSLEKSTKPEDRKKEMDFATSQQVRWERIRLDKERSNISIARDVLDSLNQTLRERVARRSPILDLNFKVSFYSAIKDEPFYYAVVTTEHSEYLDSWSAIGGVEHLPYWDSSEGPDEISRQEWSARGANWRSLMGKTGSNPSLTWEYDTTDILFAEVDELEVARAIQDYRDRLARTLASMGGESAVRKRFGIPEKDEDE